MKILALDTSTENCSVALWLEGQVFTRQELAGQRHSELILPMLQQLLAEAGLSLNKLHGIAYGCGPGSFTGLRIGCGVVQGLALAAALPVVGVSTLMALAQASGSQRAIACLDARMGEIYHAEYQKDNQAWQILSEPGLYLPQQAPEVQGNDWVAIGSGFGAYGEILQQRYQGQLTGMITDVFPQAEHIARLAIPLFEQGLSSDAAHAVPLYIRDKVALKTHEREQR